MPNINVKEPVPQDQVAKYGTASDGDPYFFEVNSDVEYLRWLCKRLYSEHRMTGDDMRDAAQRLDIMLSRIYKVNIDL